jgi:transcriptional regulator with XRE-family HTH domain
MSAKPRASNSKRGVTPARLAANGHIAARLRERMKALGMTAGDLNVRLGKSPGHTTAYGWIKGSNAPFPATREKISQILGIPIADLTPRSGKGTTAVAVARPPPAPSPPAPPRQALAEVLAFTVAADGSARLRLDITMAGGTALALLHKLMELDLIPKPETPHDRRPDA